MTTHQANQSQFVFTRKLVLCLTHLQSFAKIDNETILEKPGTVPKNNWQNLINVVKWGKKTKILSLQYLWNMVRYFLGLLIEGNPHAKVYCDIEIFCYLFPKKNYNKKTLVFFTQEKGQKKLFLGKKTLHFHPDFPVFCTLKVIHTFAQTFSHNIDLQWFIHSMLSCKNSRLQWSL